MENSPQNLPPEVQQKLEEAMNKFKNNPSLFSVLGALGSLGSLAKTAQQFGITQVTDPNAIKTMTQLQNRISGQQNTRPPESSTNQGLSSQPTGQAAQNTLTASSNSDQYARNNVHRALQPTFNPDVKGDTNRAKIAILGLLILGGYLVFQYVFHGQVPQEVIDFLNS